MNWGMPNIKKTEKTKKPWKKGFTLTELIITIGILAVLGLAFYQGFNLVFITGQSSQITRIQAEIANEWLEIIRNMPYDSIGTLFGSPQGVLPDATTTLRGDFYFTINIIPQWVDDPFDGNAEGTIPGKPIDTVPTDYKRIIVRVIYNGYPKVAVLTKSTLVAPPYLETAGDYGFLFINVFDASGQPVSQANITIRSTNLSPERVIQTTSDNSGKVQILDLSPAIYHIEVSKEGYSSDFTLAATNENPNPVKPDVGVFLSQVTQTSFQIDHVGSIQIITQDLTCQPIGNINLHLEGSKLIGREPDILKYSQDITTGSNGSILINSLEWDTYHLTLKPDQGFDLAGSIPLSPFSLAPGQNLIIRLALVPHSTNSLLVIVKDTASKLPISGAEVRLYKADYDETLITGQGHFKQTDWSGGPGQEEFVDPQKFFSDDGKINYASSGILTIKTDGEGNYYSSSSLISSTFDTGATSTAYTSILWLPLSQPPETGTSSVKFQFASNNDGSTWNFAGPNGNPDEYFDISNNNLSSEAFNNRRYFRYKVFLSTETATSSPLVSDIAVTFSSACIPSGQVFFTPLESGIYTLEVKKTGYQDFSQAVSIAGQTTLEVDLFTL